MAILEVSIVPIGTGNPSISSDIANAVSVLQQDKSLNYQITPMSTQMEGDLDRLLDLVRQMHLNVLKNAQRVHTVIVIDDRRDKVSTMNSKVEAVKKKLKAK